jgi:polyphosphate kinase
VDARQTEQLVVSPADVVSVRDSIEPSLDEPRFYVNRELSLLAFQKRVLE